jgi:hypothetical protein
VGDGTLEQLRERSVANDRVRLSVVGECEQIQQVLRDHGIAETHVMDESEGVCHLRVEGPSGSDLVGRVASLAVTNRWELRSLAHDPFTLEEVFLSLVEPENAEKPVGGSA